MKMDDRCYHCYKKPTVWLVMEHGWSSEVHIRKLCYVHLEGYESNTGDWKITKLSKEEYEVYNVMEN